MRRGLVVALLFIMFGVVPAFAASTPTPTPASSIPVHIRLQPQHPVHSGVVTVTVTTTPNASCSMKITPLLGRVWNGASSHPGRYTKQIANAKGVVVWTVSASAFGNFTLTANCSLNGSAGSALIKFFVANL